MNDAPFRILRAAARARAPLRWKPLFLVLAAAIALYWASSAWDASALPAAWARFSAWGSFHLRLVHEDSPLSFVLMPAMLVAAWAGTLLLLFDRPPAWVRLPVGAVFLFLQAAYLVFRLVA